MKSDIFFCKNIPYSFLFDKKIFLFNQEKEMWESLKRIFFPKFFLFPFRKPHARNPQWLQIFEILFTVLKTNLDRETLQRSGNLKCGYKLNRIWLTINYSPKLLAPESRQESVAFQNYLPKNEKNER